MFYFSYRVYIKLFLFSTITLLFHGFINAQSIEGYVYVDSNNNSIMDPDEKGLKGVMVSNQKDVVLTDEKGYFQLKLIEGNYIFVTKPESYQFKLDMFNNPEFYFLYKKRKTKQDLRYSSLQPIGEIPEVLYFPLYEKSNEDAYSCLLIGDPQMKDDRTLGYYKNGVIPHLESKKADFYIVLGDIANDYLGLLPKERLATSKLGIPGYRVFGNHDMNHKATGNKYASETFKLIFGPDNYSFDYGSLHYIVLNSIIYDGWEIDDRVSGHYHGGLTYQQLNWLANDLEHVPANKTIVLLSHVSLHEFFIERSIMQKLFKALENHKKVLAVSGHMHSIIAYDYTSKHGWKNSSEFEGLVAGATSGSWWSGPLDKNNIPYSTCMDGSPKGFFQLNVNKEDYNYVFHSVNEPIDLQMRSFIKNDEIRVNWFVGKRTDSVWVYIDDNPEAIEMQNYAAKDPFVEADYAEIKQIDQQVLDFERIAHLWKAKLPEGLSHGKHSIKIVAKDSKGRTFQDLKTFQINE